MDKTLLEKLKDVGKYYGTYHDLYLLCRQAAERIETLEAEVKELAEKNIRQLRETNDKYNMVSKNNDELLKMYAPTVKERDKLIEENIRLEAEVKEVSHANDGLIKRNIELGSSNNLLVVELNNLALASHSDKDVAIRDDELRDQFACVVLQGFYANPAMVEGFSEKQVAEAVYEQADAMLKAKEKKNA